MGNTASSPEPGQSIQVIGVGLSRTGTASLCAALEHLYSGPVYHGGTQMVSNPTSHIRTWISVLERTQPEDEHSAEDHKFILQNISRMLKGYIGCVDMPCIYFVEELLELYPNAKIICTVRDPDGWWKSLAPIEDGYWTLRRFVLWPLPKFRWFCAYRRSLDVGRCKELYYKPGEVQMPSRMMYERHMDYLKRVVPKEKLFFFDVRDGWAPLCEHVGKNVPVDVPFPRLNEGSNRDKIIRSLFFMGFSAWVGILVMAGATIHFGWKLVMPKIHRQ